MANNKNMEHEINATRALLAAGALTPACLTHEDVEKIRDVFDVLCDRVTGLEADLRAALFREGYLADKYCEWFDRALELKEKLRNMGG